MLRGLGWHTGWWRDPITNQDNGLREWAVKKDAAQLAEIIRVLTAEAVQIRSGVACLWHDELTLEHVRQATDLQVVEIKANSVKKQFNNGGERVIKKYVWPDDPWACAEPADVERIYGEKYRIANLLRPESVLEIGVRAGYTAAMFLLAGARRYIGLDATDTWGGTPGAVDFARQMLPTHFPDDRIEITTSTRRRSTRWLSTGQWRWYTLMVITLSSAASMTWN